MADVFSRQKRSQIMLFVRCCDNKSTELAMVAILRQHHIVGWRRHPVLFGNPDFIFSQTAPGGVRGWLFLALLSKHGTRPATNRLFWEQKLARNREIEPIEP